ncbi:MAG TPA: hypothetical protein VGL57_02105 [Solirubrobacteraceae bacterium]
MRARALAVIGMLIGGLVLALTGAFGRGSDDSVQARASPPSAVTASYYGVNSGLAFSSSPVTWDAAGAQIALLGVGTVRRDAFWSAVEPKPPIRGAHRYRWQATDELVAALAKSRLRWYPIVDYATNWAGVDGWESPPRAAYVADYAAFAGALARRYGRGGSFWRAHPQLPAMPIENYEIWNEPNFSHFWPEQSYAPERLAEMYLESQARIKKVDPTASVVLGGLVTEGVEGFLGRMVRARPRMLRGLEAVGFHPYGGGPDGGLQTTYANIRILRTALDRLFPGRSVPMEITETGWAVPPTPEAWRSARLQRLALELPRSNCNITRFIVFDWTSVASGASLSAGFGIASSDGVMTESALALKAAIASVLASGAAPRNEVKIC